MYLVLTTASAAQVNVVESDPKTTAGRRSLVLDRVTWMCFGTIGSA